MVVSFTLAQPGIALRELEDVPDGGAAEAVEALVLVADHADVSAGLGELQEELFLDVVSVLVLIHEDVAQVAGHGVRGAGIAEELVHEPLQMREVGPVGVEERALVAAVRVTDRREERVGGCGELLRSRRVSL